MKPLILVLLLCSHTPLFAEEVYRWQDAGGQTHFGDAPPEQAINPQSVAVAKTNPVYEVARVIDGDTVDLKDGPRVRLLGINAPEVARRDRAGEPFGEEAKQRLQSLITGRRVVLHYDTERRDSYQRQLAYLLLEDGSDVQSILLNEGLARALFLPPNLKQLQRYFQAETEAREKELGIWSQASHRVKSSRKAETCLKRFCRLKGKVINVERKRYTTYLTLSGGVVAALKHQHEALFIEADVSPPSLAGQTITVRGWLGQQKGRPYLKLHHPLQIEVEKEK